MGLLDDAIREHLDLKRRRGADPTEVERAEREALGPVRRNRDPSDSLDSEAPEVAETGGPAFDEPHDEAGWDQAPPSVSPTASESAPDVVPPPVFDDELSSEPTGRRPTEPVYEDELPPEPAGRRPAAPVYDDEPGYDDEVGYAEEPGHDGAPGFSHEPPLRSDPASPAADEDDRSWSAADDVDGLQAFETASPAASRSPAPRRSDPVGEETTEYHIEQRLPHEDEDAGDEDVLEETPEFLQDTPDHDRLWFEQRPPRDFDFDG